MTQPWWPDITVELQARPPSAAAIDRLDALLVVAPTAPTATTEAPGAALLARRRERAGEPAAGPSHGLQVDLPNARATSVHWLTLEPGLAAFTRLTRAREAIARIAPLAGPRLHLLPTGFADDAAAEVAVEAVLAAALASSGRLPDLRGTARRRPPPGFTAITVHGYRCRHGHRRTLAEAEGAALTRYLTTLPPNQLTPRIYRGMVTKLARDCGWQLTTFDERRLARLGAGAFLAVCQGSPTRDAAILQVRYRPAAAPVARAAPVALVGKGICFDTGGVNVKPARYMRGMHGDMAGSATALGTLLALTRLEAPFPVDCWLALAENHIGPTAYKPNDVVTALNGTSIEVVHTDAEGRMVLADTLTLASRARPAPGLVIDFATLTGACVQALGKAYSGVFSNREALAAALVAAGRRSGERLWAFPMDEDYDQALESQVADTLQCAPEGEADHILAARFLGRFLEGGVAWAHIDLSSGTRRGGLAHVPCEETGFGVRLALEALTGEQPVQALRA
jgi:leucyl aminopeptidase